MSDVPEVSLRPVVADDSEMLYRVLFETMRDYVVATWGAWDEKRVRDECTERARSPEARVILFEDQPAGLFSVERQGDHIHLDQLYVLPRFQRLGIGTKLIRDLLEEGRVCGRPVTLQVLQVNPARKFYERLGFAMKSETRERVYMEASV